MALPLGKLTILVGAGILGSVLAKEGRLPNVSDFFSGAFKIAVKQIKRDDSTKPVSRPRNDSLMAQVNSLREELQILASSRPITIVTTGGGTGGASKYGIIIVIVVVGYGYIWWKGWKLPDLMFASRRSLSDACMSVAQRLEDVYSSIRGTRRELSSGIDHVDSGLDEVVELTGSTQEKVTCVREDSERINHNVKSVRHAVRTLGQRINVIGGKQLETLEGVKKLYGYTIEIEQMLLEENARASSPSFQITSSSRNAFLPPPEPSSPVSNLSAEIQQPQPNAASASEQRNNGLSGVVEVSDSLGISNGIRGLEGAKTGSSSSGWSMPNFLSRTRSATAAVLLRTGSNRP